MVINAKVISFLITQWYMSAISLTISQVPQDARLSLSFPQHANCGSKISQSAGRLVSHVGFDQNQNYAPGTRCRWEIDSTRKGNVTIQFEKIGIRDFDFVVVINGYLKHRLDFMCNADRYRTLGKGINQALLKQIATPSFQSSTNVLVVDFCSHLFPMGNGRKGFSAIFDTTSVQQIMPVVSTPSMPITTLPTRADNTEAPWTLPLYETCGIQPKLANSSRPFSLDTRVVGGRTAPTKTWPWMCSLVLGRRHQCGCTVIDAEWIITAGHCFPRIIQDDLTDPNMLVVIGAQDLKNARIRNLFEVEKIVRHEDFINYRGISHDIALVKLRVPVQFKDNVQPACLPTKPIEELAMAGKIDCALAGWGITRSDQVANLGEIASGPDELQELVIDTLYSNEECRKAVNKNVTDDSSKVRITETMFCAGFRVAYGGHDACQGDSGGPLICNEAGKWVLQGIISYGLGCARAGIPGVYTKVHTLLPWIQEVLENQ